MIEVEAAGPLCRASPGGARGGGSNPTALCAVLGRCARGRLLRRGYNYVDGSDRLGRLDAGLFFIAYLRDPRKQFVPVQTALARRDTLNEYIRHVSSGLFACPPGVRSPDDLWGRSLFA